MEKSIQIMFFTESMFSAAIVTTVCPSAFVPEMKPTAPSISATNAPDGLSGNEDCGQMSAWYILNAMGFYQVCPGKPIYSIGRPIVDKAVINLTNGKRIEIVLKTAHCLA